jgi:hypothetical protein
MKTDTNKMMEMNKNKDVFLCMMFHSNEFEVDMSPYSPNEEAVSKILNRLDDYLSWVRGFENFNSCGLSETKIIFDND